MRPTVDMCPELDKLGRYAAGKHSADEIEAVAQHLEHCNRCAEAIEQLFDGDQLCAVMAGPDVAAHEQERAEIENLIRQVRRLRPPAPLPDHTPLPADDGAWGQAAPTVATQSEDFSFLAAAQGPEELGRLGPYPVLTFLGAGGMGLVFGAVDTQLKRPVALKAMRPALAANGTAKQRFLREAQAIAAVKHDHIVTIYQVGEDRGVPFIAMERLDGQPMDHWLKQHPRPTLMQVVRLGREIAEGLAAAHARGVVHRDIKPGNIWLEAPRERVKILDFGLARATADDAQITQAGSILGTPAFMAPEQAQGLLVDARSDLFSLGCVLYLIATGQLPFQGPSPLAVLRAVAVESPRPVRELNPEIPLPLATLIETLLAKEPADRPASAEAVIETLEVIKSELSAMGPASAKPASAAASAPVPDSVRRRHRRAVLILTSFLIAGLALAGVIIVIKHPGRPDTEIRAPDGARVVVGPKNQITIEPPSAPSVPTAATSPFDLLSRDQIPADELAAAGGGEPANAPAELVAVFGDSRDRPWGTTLSTSYSPDGQRLATTEAIGGPARIWDVATGRLLMTLPAPAEAVAFSPDGTRLATCAGHARPTPTAAWDASTGKPIQTFGTIDQAAYTLAFSPDGKHLATAGSDRIVRIWDVRSGAEVHALTGHTQQLKCLVFSPGGKYLASSTADRQDARKPVEVKLWDMATGREFKHFAEACSVRLAFMVDSRRLLVGTLESILIRDIQTGTEKHFPSGAGRLLTLSPDGNRMAVSGPGLYDLTVWDPGQPETPPVLLPRVVNAESVTALAFSPDSRFLAVGSESLRYHDFETGQVLSRLQGPVSSITTLNISPDGKRVMAGEYNKVLWVWEVATGKELPELRKEAGGQRFGAALSVDGKRLARAVHGPSNGIILSDPVTGADGLAIPVPVPSFQAGAISPDGKRVAVFSEPGTHAKIWDAETGQELRTLEGLRDVSSAAFSPDGRWLATADAVAVVVWDAASGQRVQTFKGVAGYQVAFSPDGRRLAVGMRREGRVQVWDIDLGVRLFQTAMPEKLDRVLVAYSPDGQWLATAEYLTGAIFVLDAASGTERCRMILPGAVRSLAFAPDCRHLLTGNGNGTVYVLRLDVAGAK